MNELERYNNELHDVVIPRETVAVGCFVNTPKQMFMALMAGERVCFREYNRAAMYYIRAVEIFRSIYTENMSDYEFVLKLNNYIVRNIKYDYGVLNKTRLTAEDAESFEIDAPLFKSKGVCAAKSKFFSLLCCLANIKTVLVTGSLKGSSRDVRHAWNKVYLRRPSDDTPLWWNIDTTNNRIHRETCDFGAKDYFLLKDAEIMQTHFFIDYPETSEYKQINYAATGSFEYPIS